MAHNELGDNVILKNKLCANIMKDGCVMLFLPQRTRNHRD